MHLHKIEMELKLTCVIYEIFLIAYPNIYMEVNITGNPPIILEIRLPYL